MMKWIFTLFMRPAEVTVALNSHIQRFVVNLNDEITQILDPMGPPFKKYYFVKPTCEIQVCGMIGEGGNVRALMSE